MTEPLFDLPATPTPEPWCVEVKDIVILSSRQGVDWWFAYRSRYEPIGRIVHIPGTAVPQGDHCRVLCDDREHAEWLAAHMVEFGGVPKTAVKACRMPKAATT
ncbi:hypothetical protein AB0J28_00510 [Streptosporangium canum]|uniref:hypothetical protein n=1 Tax=Streptosporangium canum TaxID=324952 RepID=UPI00344AD131